MFDKRSIIFTLLFNVLFLSGAYAQDNISLDNYDILWKKESINSSGSMPCGGGNVGLNVWVENGDLLFYIAQSGAFDENNTLLKLGRIRIRLFPNPFRNGDFSQLLKLSDGSIYIQGKNKSAAATIHLWVEVHRPVIHAAIQSNKNIKVSVRYETWRNADRIVSGRENLQNSYKFAPQGTVKMLKDNIAFDSNRIIFFHRNPDTTIFDVTVHQQQLDKIKTTLFNPLKHLTSGGFIAGTDLAPAGTSSGTYGNTPYKAWQLKSKKAVRNTDIIIGLQTLQCGTTVQWKTKLAKLYLAARSDKTAAWLDNKKWWRRFWNRSFIITDPVRKDSAAIWKAGRNYQLFRYMLACNAYGEYPTKFNGGLFTFDPQYVDSVDRFTPDFRNWGGGIMTAQNQRLVYYPMLKSGDFDMMQPAFNFYLRLLHTAEARSETYWHHAGACFSEQLENFGLPDCSEYGWKRPSDFDPGVEYNAWLEYEWDTVLEFCDMMLKSYQYQGKGISIYLPFIKSCLTFFDQYYRYLAKKRGRDALDQNGHLVLYPGSAGETYKMAYNASSTIAGLQTVLSELLRLPDSCMDAGERKKWTAMKNSIPPLPLRNINGHIMIAPAQAWQNIRNTETPQLYAVFPWRIFGIGKSGLDTALNTWKYDTTAIKNRSYVGWKQDNIFAACLGLTGEAAALTLQKLHDGPYRFPAFWGPGFDWSPDHNWGGSAMIGIQDMLLQNAGKKILLFPAWPRQWDVHFKLHAPDQTIVEAELKNGAVQSIKVTPQYRAADIVNMLRDNVRD